VFKGDASTPSGLSAPAIATNESEWPLLKARGVQIPDVEESFLVDAGQI
jgi:hypothetical protein